MHFSKISLLIQGLSLLHSSAFAYVPVPNVEDTQVCENLLLFDKILTYLTLKIHDPPNKDVVFSLQS